MSLRISHLSFDAHDANAQAHWWSAALGWSEDPEDPNLPGHEESLIFAPDGRQRLDHADRPGGNELCVLSSELDRPDPYAHLVHRGTASVRPAGTRPIGSGHRHHPR